MWLDILFVVLGLIFLVAIMAFVLNPPESWVKRAFQRKKSEGPPGKPL